jgi:hypothetical protein
LYRAETNRCGRPTASHDEIIGAVDVAAQRIGEGAKAADRGETRIVNRGGLGFLLNLIGNNDAADELCASFLRATRHINSLGNENLTRPDRAVVSMKSRAFAIGSRAAGDMQGEVPASDNAVCPQTSAQLG